LDDPPARPLTRLRPARLGRHHGRLTHTGDNTTVAYLPKKVTALVVLADTDIEAAEALPTPKPFTALAESSLPATSPPAPPTKRTGREVRHGTRDPRLVTFGRHGSRN
jgi:hypothetical protein